MRIAWTRAASKDLDSIEEYISKDDPLAAMRQVLRVMDAVEENFSEAPSIGKPGRISGTREFYVTGTPYIVAYRIKDNYIEVLRVIHGARQWPEKM